MHVQDIQVQDSGRQGIRVKGLNGLGLNSRAAGEFPGRKKNNKLVNQNIQQ